MEAELSIVMPCLDEARTVESCVKKATDFLARSGVAGEVIVADNGSNDGSPELAERSGARVVQVPGRGYGAALRGGIEASRGRFVVMGDCDLSYDFAALDPFLERLRAGDDLVVGNRFRGGIEPGAMPALHRHLGNPALSVLARLLFRVPVGDVYCGLRGFSRAAFDRLDLQSVGMEFALEMIVKAKLLGMRLSEVPATLSRDGRGGPSHLRSWRDGRRSLLLYLSSMPRGLFLFPGLVVMLVGLVLGALVAHGAVAVGGAKLDVHTLLYCGSAVVLGSQLVLYSVVLRLLMVTARLLPPDPVFHRRVSAFTLEHGVALGGAFVLAGFIGTWYLLDVWRGRGFSDLDPLVVMRVAIPSVTAITLGPQIAFATLFLSLVKWQIRSRSSPGEGRKTT